MVTNNFSYQESIIKLLDHVKLDVHVNETQYLSLYANLILKAQINLGNTEEIKVMMKFKDIVKYFDLLKPEQFKKIKESCYKKQSVLIWVDIKENSVKEDKWTFFENEYKQYLFKMQYRVALTARKVPGFFQKFPLLLVKMIIENSADILFSEVKKSL